MALAHFMKGMSCYPPKTKDPTDVAQLYFQVPVDLLEHESDA